MKLRKHLLDGQMIPAHPLALTAGRKLDERRQCALTRYYVASGAGGIAVGVHSTQFEIREPGHALLRPVLELASKTADEALANAPRTFAKIAGACGDTRAAVAEAELARSLGYHAVLLSLGALRDAPEEALVEHCRAVAATMPLIGFYLQPAVGGRILPYRFWRRFSEIENVVAIKIAPFNRYQTLDVVRAVAESGRKDVALYTGNDDSIVADLVTPFAFDTPGGRAEMRIAGGLLGHWAVWARKAVELLDEIKAKRGNNTVDLALLARGVEITDCNAAFFDAANRFAGCIPGIHEVLRGQGLLAGTWCLNPHEVLSPGQADEIARVHRAYPHLNDDDFVAANVDRWMR
ncbi:MAG TPA: dihydrodipicolinate synthase family protein [Verrucomicrobiae bacterium]|nr:dihydrodipicolinate synthase family protein [Verrucomicrobiae bacterium]